MGEVVEVAGWCFIVDIVEKFSLVIYLPIRWVDQVVFEWGEIINYVDFIASFGLINENLWEKSSMKHIDDTIGGLSDVIALSCKLGGCSSKT